MRNKDTNKKLNIIGQSADLWVTEIWDAFITKLATTDSKKEIKSLVEGFLSEDERRSVARRLAVTALLRSGYMQKDIGRMLWVSPQTINGLKKGIVTGTTDYKSYRKLKSKARPIENVKPLKTNIGEEFLFLCTDILQALLRPRGVGITNKYLN